MRGGTVLFVGKEQKIVASSRMSAWGTRYRDPTYLAEGGQYKVKNGSGGRRGGKGDVHWVAVTERAETI